IHLSEKYLCFKDKLVGLHAPEIEKDTLQAIYNRFKDEQFAKLTKLWILSTSAESMINLETTCKKEDIDSLPFPEDYSYLELSPSEQIIQDDVLNYYIHLGKAIGDRGE